MLTDVERWSPEEELRLLEELAEEEAWAFEMEEELAIPAAIPENDRAWVAYWHLPPNGIRSKSRGHHRPARGR